MRTLRILTAIAAVWLGIAGAALAQVGPGGGASNPIVVAACGTAPYTYTAGRYEPLVVDVNGNLCSSVSVSASVAGFAPSLSFATATATAASSASTALPTNTGTVTLDNTGTDPVSCTLANGAATAVADEIVIQPGSGKAVSTTYGATTYDHFACINQSGVGSNDVVAAGGSGLAAGWGGGGSGSGGGAVTIADGADVAEGAVADAAATAGSTGTVSAKLRLATSQLDTMATLLGTIDTDTGLISTYTSRLLSGALPVGGGAATATTAQAVGGSYNSTPITLTDTQQSEIQLDANGYVKVNVAAGGAGGGAVYGPTANGSPAANPPVIIGGTADGSATGNVANAMIVAGNTAGTTDPAVLTADANLLAAVNSAIPAGTNLIGKVGFDQTTPGTTNGVDPATAASWGLDGTAGSPSTVVQSVQGVSGGTTIPVRLSDEYPVGSTVSQDSDTGTTGATASSLPAVASNTQFVCGISIRANATAAATGNATLSDGTKTYNFTQWTAPTASGLGVIEELFRPCRPATAANTAWTLTSAAPGTGGVVSTAIWGYYKP